MDRRLPSLTRARAALAALSVAAVAAAAGCGSDSPADKDSASANDGAGVAAAALGPGPWNARDVSEFLQPAYAAAGEDLGAPLLSFSCLSEPGAPRNVFACVAAYGNGLVGWRAVSLDRAGRVAAQEDLQRSQNVNPGVHCSQGAGSAYDDLPDCDSVRQQAPTGQLPAVNAALYGRPGAQGPAEDEGPAPEDEGPAPGPAAGMTACPGGVSVSTTSATTCQQAQRVIDAFLAVPDGEPGDETEVGDGWKCIATAAELGCTRDTDRITATR